MRRTYCRSHESISISDVSASGRACSTRCHPPKLRRSPAGSKSSGFPTLWIPETIGRDPFVTATLLLSATSTLKVATGIANIYARDALTMANTQRSLEEAFPGRFLLGSA